MYSFAEFTEADNTEFQRLKYQLIQATGMAYYQDKDKELQAKIRERMLRHGVADFDSYLRELNGSDGAEELQRLIQTLSVGETYFFRHHEQLGVLQDQILPRLIKRNRSQKRMSIWSAGCATGEEAYTLAILLFYAYPELREWQIDILGTDLNAEFLHLARQGRYRERSFRGEGKRWRDACFLPEDEAWVVLPKFRQGVRFRQHNLLDEPPATGFDLIVCRNVLIYFDKLVQRQVVERFHQALGVGGWLMLGAAELTPIDCRPFLPNPLASMSCFVKGTPAHLSALPPWLHALPEEPLPFVIEPSPLPLAPEPIMPQSPPVQTAIPPLPPTLAVSPPTAPASEETVNRIRQLANLGQLTDAAELCRQELEKDDLQPSIYYLLALILQDQGDDAGARKALQQVIYLNRRHVLAHYQLALVLHRLGESQPARKALGNAERLIQSLTAEMELQDGEGMQANELADLIRLKWKGRL